MSRFTVIDCEQRSEMWYAARAGRVTASKADCVLAKIKTGEAAKRSDYRLQLVTERITGKPQEDEYVNSYMQRGIDLEPTAAGEYEAKTGLLLQTCGFLQATDCHAGASLDRYVGNFEGIVSFKCPKSTTHVEYLKRRRLPPEYVPQATHEMWLVTQAQWYDFVSFDDRLPEGLQLLVVRVERSELEKEIAAYDLEIKRFLAEIDAEVEMLSKMRAA